MRHLQSFKYVKAIAETGSIRGAAENLAISPSALNRHIQSLELDLGIQIFDRLTKGVRLSIEGELFYQFAHRQLIGFDKLKSQISDIKGLRTGMVRIGISADLGQSFLHQQIASYQADHSHVSFCLHVVQQDQLELALERNQIDFALFYQPILTKNLQVIHACETKIHAALPNGAPIRNKNGLMLYDLIDHAIIKPEHHTELRKKLDAACEKLGIDLYEKLECADPLPHLAACMTSRIAFCLPLPDEQQAYNRLGYKLVPIASSELTTGYINIVASTHNLMPLAAQKFIEQIIAALEEQKGWI
ncbi:MAG: LysR family transcriptional regulator [Cohaesibacter sp.]|nr:LysR family transcriptional regulator [Cohaesibacter sp.]